MPPGRCSTPRALLRLLRLQLVFFLQLVMLPSSLLLYKVWLFAVGAYISFAEIFMYNDVSGLPAHPMSAVGAGWAAKDLCVCLDAVVIPSCQHATHHHATPGHASTCRTKWLRGSTLLGA